MDRSIEPSSSHSQVSGMFARTSDKAAHGQIILFDKIESDHHAGTNSASLTPSKIYIHPGSVALDLFAINTTKSPSMELRVGWGTDFVCPKK